MKWNPNFIREVQDLLLNKNISITRVKRVRLYGLPGIILKNPYSWRFVLFLGKFQVLVENPFQLQFGE